MQKKKKVESLLVNAVKKTNAQDLIKENSHQVKSSKVISKGPQIVNFEGSLKRKNNLRINLAEWTNRDFAIHIKQKYYKLFKDDWPPTIISITTYFNNVKEAINDILGFCDNITVKEYIDYFFSHWAKFYKNKNKKNILYLTVFKNSEPITNFSSQYNYKQSVDKYTKKEDKSVGLAEEILKNSYLLGMQNFVSEFGLILPCNWLINKLNYNIKNAVNLVAKAFLELYEKDNLNEVLKNTQKYEPYPIWFPFKKHEVILLAVSRKIKKQIGLKVKFVDFEEKYDFLRRKKK